MVNIFIEAKDKKTPEAKFLTAILDRMGISPDKYFLAPTGGYTNLLDSNNAANANAMRANTDAGGKNLVIFDADSSDNNGGFERRRRHLLQKKDEMGLDFELFLWPDNNGDGDVEVLMERIARDDLYPEFFDCFRKYECCISKRKAGDGKPFYSTPNRKGKLHTYITSLPGSRTKKSKSGSGDWQWYDGEIWDLDSESLNPIKGFLAKHLL